jgi:transcriptional regulator with XRE-family HTH domain
MPASGSLNDSAAEILRSALAASSMTARTLGARIGMSPATVWEFLATSRPLGVDDLWHLCNGLGLDPLTVVRDASRATRDTTPH